jgi:hypothetical protein
MVLTEATLISEEEFSRLWAEGSKGIGNVVEPGGKNRLSFRVEQP